MTTTSKKKLLSQSQVGSTIQKLVQGISKRVREPRSEWAFVGIQRRGVPLARRLAGLLEEAEADRRKFPVGTLDITFYRDDVDEAALHPVVQDTDLAFDVTGKTVFLVDDVLYTGRTVRCALDELMDFGRPRKVYLVALVDRGHRELPIQADFVGEAVPTGEGDSVEVHLEEIDGEDAVWVMASAKLEARGSTK
jgi:pyrimidine operon attenuation protein / uracil phosphoribosyltransferase